MSWIEELGEKELSDKHVKLFVNIIELAADTEEGTDGESVKEQLIKYTDTAINNLNKIRKAAENGK